MTKDKDKSSKGQWHGGKGSIQKSDGQDKYAENYDKIFNSGKKKRLSKRERVLMDPLAASQKSDKKKEQKWQNMPLFLVDHYS